MEEQKLQPLDGGDAPDHRGKHRDSHTRSRSAGWTLRDSQDLKDMSVRVCVRVRPFIAQEKVDGCSDCASVRTRAGEVVPDGGDGRVLVLGENRTFTFDTVFGTAVAQSTIYDHYISELVAGCFNGFNATVLAYGQTGSGKTFTMGTNSLTNLLPHELGIVPRVLRDVFQRVRAEKGAKFMVRVGFLEIYTEMVRDLLHPETNPKTISIRETAGGEITVQGLREEEAFSAEAALELLEQGTLARTTGSTLMNASSSRSHAIFTLTIERRDAADKGRFTSAKFHLVDLAGSERAKRTGAVGIRFKESIRINQGLLALGNVISALGDPRKVSRGVHVPYRESKLTRLLQDSLGGNSRTVMIACASPADSNYEETLSTLKYANRARNIKNKPVRNVQQAEVVQIAELQGQISRLQSQLDTVQSGAPASTHEDDTSAMMDEIQRLNSRLEAAEQENVATSEHLFSTQSDLALCLRSMAQVQAGLRQLVRDDPTTALDLGPLADQLEPQVEFPDVKLKDVASARVVRPVSARDSPARRSQGNSIWGSKQDSKMQERLAAAEEAAQQAAALGAKVRNLQKLYDEAKQQLHEDEEIFRQKLETITTLHSQLSTAVDQNETLKEGLQHADDRIAELSAEVDALKASTRPSTAAEVTEEGDEGGAEAGIADLSVSTGRELTDEDASVLFQAPDDDDLDSDHEDQLSAVASSADRSALDTLQDQLAKVEQQNQVLETSLVDVELAKHHLEKQKQEQEQAYQRAQQEMHASMRDLSAAIRHKEELIRVLVHSENEAAEAAQAFEARVRKLEKDVARYKGTLQSVQADQARHEEELLDTKAQAARDAEEQLAKKYRAKLVRAKAQLKEAQRKQQALKRLDAERLKTRDVTALRAELQSLQADKERLASQLKKEEKEERARSETTKRELSRLRRQADLERRKGAELRSENERQRRELQKRTREAELAQKRLSVAKAHAASPMRGRSPASHHGTPKAQRRVSASMVRRRWTEVERAIENVVKQQHGSQKVQRLVTKRNGARDERAECLRVRAALMRRKQAAMKQVSVRQGGLQHAVKTIEAEIRQLAGSSSDVDTRALQQLEAKRQLAYKELASIDKVVAADAFLPATEEAELQRLTDQIETLEAAIEFESKSIVDAEKTASKSASPADDGVLKLITKFPEHELRTAFKKATQSVLELRKQLASQESKEAQMEVALAEKASEAEALGAALRRARLNFDKRLTTRQQRHEAKVARLIRQLRDEVGGVPKTAPEPLPPRHTAQRPATAGGRAADSPVSPTGAMPVPEVVKENAYYKSTNRELRRHLRAAVKANENLKAEATKRANQASHLAKQNNKLKYELTNIRAFLRRHAADAPVAVRVSASGLREISQDEVALRASQQSLGERV